MSIFRPMFPQVLNVLIFCTLPGISHADSGIKDRLGISMFKDNLEYIQRPCFKKPKRRAREMTQWVRVFAVQTGGPEF